MCKAMASLSLEEIFNRRLGDPPSGKTFLQGERRKGKKKKERWLSFRWFPKILQILRFFDNKLTNCSRLMKFLMIFYCIWKKLMKSEKRTGFWFFYYHQLVVGQFSPSVSQFPHLLSMDNNTFPSLLWELMNKDKSLLILRMETLLKGWILLC